MTNKKTLLLQETWGKKQSYYDQITTTHQDISSHSSYQLIKPLLSQTQSMIEFGCGNGNVIGNIIKLHPHIKGYGVDFSSLAIEDARRMFKKALKFYTGDAESFSFGVKADMTSSFYTFEHLDKPEVVLKNMIKHTKKNGYIVIVCPNFGSLIYPSPCYKKGWWKRFCDSMQRDWQLLSRKKIDNLHWEKVDPIIDPDGVHISDHDATIEPYIASFKKYLADNYPNIQILTASSGWNTVTSKNSSKKFRYITAPIRLLSSLGIPPFTNWGPTFLFVGRKVR